MNWQEFAEADWEPLDESEWALLLVDPEDEGGGDDEDSPLNPLARLLIQGS